MKTLIILLILIVSNVAIAQEVAKPDAKLLDAALESYLKDNKARFKFAPSEFIIEAADKSVYQNVKKQIGGTAIVVKTKKELQDYSTQKTGQGISFFVISVSKSGANFMVDIIDDGIKCTMKDGAASFEYNSLGVARACSLEFSGAFAFQSIDCLLLPTDK